MEYCMFGCFGFQVFVLSFGVGIFGGIGLLFSVWGNIDVDEVCCLIDICFDVGVNLFDMVDVYFDGVFEWVFGVVFKGCCDQVLILIKMGLLIGDGLNDVGMLCVWLVCVVDDVLCWFDIDYIDLL